MTDYTIKVTSTEVKNQYILDCDNTELIKLILKSISKCNTHFNCTENSVTHFTLKTTKLVIKLILDTLLYLRRTSKVEFQQWREHEQDLKILNLKILTDEDRAEYQRQTDEMQQQWYERTPEPDYIASKATFDKIMKDVLINEEVYNKYNEKYVVIKNGEIITVFDDDTNLYESEYSDRFVYFYKLVTHRIERC